jgi:3-deoxy-7-phosphoheptulonate synthase
VAAQIAAGSPHILGVMLESNLVAGRQDLEPGRPLVFGQSITDGCLGWEETEEALRRLAEAKRTANAAVEKAS